MTNNDNKQNSITIEQIIELFPQQFTPSQMDKIFKIYDGGKTIRRLLRKHFANECNHNFNDKWTFNKSIHQNIIEFFANKYGKTFDMECQFLKK